jgi:hypothetical protein
MPSPLSVVQRLDVVTGPFAYVRLPGDREAVDALTPKLDHVVIDRSDQVAADAEAIGLLRRRATVVAFVNNHFTGYAPETVRQLARWCHPERPPLRQLNWPGRRGAEPGAALTAPCPSSRFRPAWGPR